MLTPRQSRWGPPHLDPLGSVVVWRRPGVGLSLLIQSGELRVPRESVNAPCAERAGGWNLPIWDQAGLHTQWLRATCRVWINCEWKGDGKKDGGKQQKEEKTPMNKPKGKTNQFYPENQGDWKIMYYTHKEVQRGWKGRRCAKSRRCTEETAEECTQVHRTCPSSVISDLYVCFYLPSFWCALNYTGVFCVFTIEFTSHQLHAQRTCLAAHHRDDADVLGHNRRVEKIGLCAVVICVAHKNL